MLIAHKKTRARQRDSNGRFIQKYICDDRSRQLIIDLYDGSKARTDELSIKLGVSSRVVMRWAKEIAKHGFNWSEEEEKFLEENFYKMSSEAIAHRLGRTVSAVRGKIQRMRLYRADKRNGYTMMDLMMGLGIQDHCKVEKWINLGWLKGKKISSGDSSARPDPWCFAEKDIRAFIFAHPEQVDPKKFTQEGWLWVIDILSGDKGIGRLDDDKYGERTI